MTNTQHTPKVLGTVALAIPITDADLTDILVTAMEGGIGYWCRRVELDAASESCVLTGAEGENPDDCTTHVHSGDQRDNEFSSTWTARMLFEGRTVNFYVDCESDQYWKPLTLPTLLRGVQRWAELRASQGKLPALDDGHLDCGDIDVVEADVILQYALLDDVVFG